MKQNIFDTIAGSMGVALPIILGIYAVCALFVGQWIGAFFVFAGIVLIAITRPGPIGN